MHKKTPEAQLVRANSYQSHSIRGHHKEAGLPARGSQLPVQGAKDTKIGIA
jgi:hypothetical protein